MGIQAVGDGVSTITNVNSGKVLNVQGNFWGNGGNVWQWDNPHETSSQWRIQAGRWSVHNYERQQRQSAERTRKLLGQWWQCTAVGQSSRNFFAMEDTSGGRWSVHNYERQQRGRCFC